MNQIKRLTRYLRAKNALKYIRQDETVLDLGAGDQYIKKYLPYYTGLDIKDGFNIEKDMEQLKSNSYDVVIALAVIEHINNWRNMLKNCCRIARKRVILTTPFRKAEKFIVLYSPHVVHEHVQYFTRETFLEEGYYPSAYELFALNMNQLIVIDTDGDKHGV